MSSQHSTGLIERHLLLYTLCRKNPGPVQSIRIFRVGLLHCGKFHPIRFPVHWIEILLLPSAVNSKCEFPDK